MIYEGEAAGVGTGRESAAGSPGPGPEGVCLTRNVPVPPEDTCWQLLHTDEGRNNGPSLCVHHPDTISEPQCTMITGSKITEIGFHIQALDTGVTEIPAHKQPLSPRSTLLAPRSHLRAALLLLTGRHLICTSALFSERTGRWRPTDTCGNGAPYHRTCCGGRPPTLPSCGPIVHCLILFREQLKPRVASIQHEQVHRGGQKASL